MSTLSSHCTRLPSATNLHLCHRSRFLSQHFHFPLLLSAHDYQKLTPLRISLQNPPKSSSYLGSRTLRIRSSMDSATSTQPKPFSVLFVCLGNICRSPAAEGVFRDIVKKRGLDSEFEIDSAGTINYHEVDDCLRCFWLLGKFTHLGFSNFNLLYFGAEGQFSWPQNEVSSKEAQHWDNILIEADSALRFPWFRSHPCHG